MKGYETFSGTQADDFEYAHLDEEERSDSRGRRRGIPFESERREVRRENRQTPRRKSRLDDIWKGR